MHFLWKAFAGMRGLSFLHLSLAPYCLRFYRFLFIFLVDSSENAPKIASPLAYVKKKQYLCTGFKYDEKCGIAVFVVYSR